MDLSKKIATLIDEVNDYFYPERDNQFITLSLYFDGHVFQAWFDKWDSAAKEPTHEGAVKELDYIYGQSLPNMINDLSKKLDEHKDSHPDSEVNRNPEIITRNGKRYKLVPID